MASLKAPTWSDEVDEGLLHAVIEGKLDRVKYYVEKGADVHQVDAEGRKNPLRLAAIRDHIEIVKYLVEECKVSPAKDGRVLHMTVMAGSHLKDIFTYLVKMGANVNGVDPKLGTPLMLSIREDADYAVTRWLVESMGADVSVETSQGTALHNACEYGDIALIDFLMAHGGEKVLHNPNVKPMTPLALAASKARNHIVEHLVKKYGANVKEPDAIFLACQNDHIDTVQLLCELGADPNIMQPSMKCYPLHLAASNNFVMIVDILLKFGAKVDCEEPRGYTPLFMAASEGYTKCVKKLLDAGANANHRSQEDYTTAIFHAVNANRLGVVEVLLQHNADPLSTRNEKNETLAEIARHNGHDKLANLLESWVKSTPEEHNKICGVCYKYQPGEAKRCARCKARWYCSAACQKQDWPNHKANCTPSS